MGAPDRAPSTTRTPGCATATTPTRSPTSRPRTPTPTPGSTSHADLVEELFGEIKSRIQETDESVPVRHGPWWYVTRTVEGQSYPVFCRGRSIDDAPTRCILDCNAEAAGHDYFDVHAVEPSPDHSLLAWSSDLDGSERYTLRVRDLPPAPTCPTS